jgi:polysaccharide biosynthesis protein PslH
VNVLCVSAFCPHERADNAGALDVHHMLRRLAERHEVTLVCAVTEADREALPSLESIVRHVVAVPAYDIPSGWRYALWSAASLPTALPAIAFLNNRRSLRTAIQELADRDGFDVAHFAFTQTMHLRSLLPPELPAVIDEPDIAFERRSRFARTVSNPLVRYSILWDSAKLKRYELRGLQRFDGVLLRTQREADLLRKLTQFRRLLVVPPWVDVSFRDEVAPQPEEPAILFYGALWRPVNQDAALWLAREIFPRVRERVPQARLLLVGSRPPSALRALSNGSIEVTGFVDSVAPYYRRAAVAVAPLRAGSGIRGKVLQSLGVGRPVVATPIGAEGIDAAEGDGLFVRGEAETVAAAAADLLTDPDPGRLYAAGRRYFDRSYRWDDAVAEWEALLGELAAAA